MFVLAHFAEVGFACDFYLRYGVLLIGLEVFSGQRGLKGLKTVLPGKDLAETSELHQSIFAADPKIFKELRRVIESIPFGPSLSIWFIALIGIFNIDIKSFDISQISNIIKFTFIKFVSSVKVLTIFEKLILLLEDIF
jgi:hypothetical protein